MESCDLLKQIPSTYHVYEFQFLLYPKPKGPIMKGFSNCMLGTFQSDFSNRAHQLVWLQLWHQGWFRLYVVFFTITKKSLWNLLKTPVVSLSVWVWWIENFCGYRVVLFSDAFSTLAERRQTGLPLLRVSISIFILCRSLSPSLHFLEDGMHHHRREKKIDDRNTNPQFPPQPTQIWTRQ